MKLVYTRGLPGSGKTTWAIEYAKEHGFARVNNDCLRDMLGIGWEPGDKERGSELVAAIRFGAIDSLLARGHSVIVDNTNLDPEAVRELRGLANLWGAEVSVSDFTDVSLDECIRRDASRCAGGGMCVGEQVIREMHDAFLKERTA